MPLARLVAWPSWELGVGWCWLVLAGGCCWLAVWLAGCCWLPGCLAAWLPGWQSSNQWMHIDSPVRSIHCFAQLCRAVFAYVSSAICGCWGGAVEYVSRGALGLSSWALLDSPGLSWAPLGCCLELSCELFKGCLGLFSDSKLAQLGSSDL